MCKRLFFLFFILLAGGLLRGQNESSSTSAKKDSTSKSIAKNSFFVEVGGNAVESQYAFDPSLNYDRIFYIEKKVRASFRIGCAIPIPRRPGDYYLNSLAMLNLLVGKRTIFFEIGGGYEHILHVTPWSDDIGNTVTFTTGLRYQPQRQSIIVRAGLMLTVTGLGSSGIYFGRPVGVSIGYSF